MSRGCFRTRLFEIFRAARAPAETSPRRSLPIGPLLVILNIMRGKLILALVVLSSLITAGAARADEIRLKDGTKIIGTIVGFENDSFRVETSFGFALIQKDKVADINITGPKKESEPKPKAAAPAPAASSASPSMVPAVVKEPAAVANTEANAIAPMHPPTHSVSSGNASANAEMVAPKITSVAAAAPVPPVVSPTPPPAPEPLVIRDEIRDLRVLVVRASDAVPDQAPYDTEASALRHRLNGARDVRDGVPDGRLLDPRFERLLADVKESLSLGRDLAAGVERQATRDAWNADDRVGERDVGDVYARGHPVGSDGHPRPGVKGLRGHGAEINHREVRDGARELGDAGARTFFELERR